ncbi:hypothetical protein AX768_09205 [Burkholderia sp. PAMC 28687]|uniref:hypothetical protein n=1 Tax=Burkholderia sp. PAMC 28687 TaxID=1795874 RepID=UPI000782DA53|nr:hypothetical protein [Burkholderia sp. PAMC 28687]AMM14246.1 hypothetical protein AX768_09205 [Burkholderia sp. PAMC 28687]
MRNTRIYTVPAAGRDKGKRFLITEMPASVSEDWAARLIFAMMNSGADIPDEVAGAGLAGLAAMNIGTLIKAISRVPYTMAKPLLDEMMECVQVMPDPTNANVVRPLIEDDCEEVATRLLLRKEVFSVHLDHFMSAARSEASGAAASTPA